MKTTPTHVVSILSLFAALFFIGYVVATGNYFHIATALALALFGRHCWVRRNRTGSETKGYYPPFKK